MQRLGSISGLTTFMMLGVICTPQPSFAQTLKFEFDQCRGSKDPNLKVQYCSVIIQRSKDKSQIERAYNSRGLANMALKYFSNAVGDFTKAFQMDPHNSGYVDNRQGAFFALGRFDLALTDANAAVRLSPKAAFAYRSRGIVYGAMERYENAINDISTAIVLDPKWVDLFIDRGILYSKARRYDSAISDFNRAIELMGDLGWAFRERGLTYMRMGNREQARSDLSAAIRTRPDDIELIAALRELEPSSRGRDASKPQDTPTESSGTGFFVASNRIVTNNHVIKDCGGNPIRVFYPERKPERAYISGADDINDLALLQTELPNTSVASFRFAARLGDSVATYGFPFPGLLSSSGNFTLGNVTSLTGMNDDTRLLQTSTPTQPGNSGGPLLDMTGSVVGVMESQLRRVRQRIRVAASMVLPIGVQ